MRHEKLIGGTLIVAGTSIGAAMLAMPLAMAKVGFALGVAMLLFICFIMTYAARIVSSLYQHLNTDATIAKIAGYVLGKQYQIMTSCAICALLYALITAYLAGLSNIISGYVIFNGTVLSNKRNIVSVLFCLCTMNLILPTRALDYSNRLFFTLKSMVFIAITVILLPNVSVEKLLTSYSNAMELVHEHSNLLALFSIVATSFGFHASIPFIYKYLDRDASSYNKAIAYGNILVAIVYMVWIVLTIGTIPYDGANSFISIWSANDDLSIFISSLCVIVKSDILRSFINTFVVLAIVTSLLGVAAGLFDFVLEVMGYDSNNMKHRVTAALATFLLPTILVLTNPTIFIQALGLAGMALMIIAIIIPCLICLQLNSHSDYGLDSINITILYLCFVFGVVTMVGELMTFW